MRSAAIRAASRATVGSRNALLELRLMLFGGLLAPLGRFWAQFWPWLDPKGVPKFFFLLGNLEKMRKRDPKKKARKT